MNTYMWNEHRMFITHIGIPKHETTYDFLFQVRNFLLPLSLKVFRHKESEAQSFYADISISLPPSPRAALAARPSASLESQPSSSTAEQRLTSDFSKYQPTLPVMTSFTSPGQISIWGLYFDIPEWYIHSARRVKTCAHIASRKVISLTKPERQDI